MFSVRFGPMPSISCRRCLFDGVEHLFVEGFRQLPGVNWADALDHSRGEVLLDALGRRRWRRTQEVGAELHAVCPIVDPPATRLDELAGADRRRMTDDGDQIAWPRAVTRSTQKPLSSLWKVTLSTRPARFSRAGSAADDRLTSDPSGFAVRLPAA